MEHETPVRRARSAWGTVAAELWATGDPACALAAEQGFVLTRRQARCAGLDERDVRRLVRRGRWTAPRYGVVCPLPATDAGPSAAGPEIAAAAAALVWTDTAISHASATSVHGLPLLGPVGAPALTADRGNRPCSSADIALHVAGLHTDEVDSWFGAPITSVPRTIVDLARTRGLRAGLVAADAAMHAGLATRAALNRAVERQTGWPGVRAARRVVELADAAAESPLESLTRLCLVGAGLPTPELQVWIETEGGGYRVDMVYRRARVVIEADGLLKYRDDPLALVAEKRRQEHLERAGYRVIRVLWEDVVPRPDRTVARVRAALVAR